MMHDKTSGYVIAILSNGKVLREDKGTVYLPFYSKYQIRIKNPKSTRVGVSVDIDGTDVTNGKVIIDGNSSFDLKRMILNDNLNSGPSLEFVPLKDSRVQDPTEKQNGIVKVTFWEETVEYVYTLPYIYQDGIKWDYDPQCAINASPVYGSGGSTSCPRQSVLNTNVFTVDSTPRAKSLSNGATVPGKNISQAFTNVTFNCGILPSATLELRLIGTNKAHIVQNTRTCFCTACGTKIATQYKFCPACGKRNK